MPTETKTSAIIGLSLLGFSACLELLCLFIIRILAHTTRGGHISTIRSWLHVSAAIEQISFIIFHVKYHFLTSDFEIQDTCIVLRFTSTVASTLTNTWIFVIASFYLVLTIKPAKCFTFHSRFLSHCITWTWICVSCLMYLMLSFLLKEGYHKHYIHPCWDNISTTIHMYLTYGNEFIPFILTFLFLSCARCRVPIRREMLQCFTQHSEYHVDVKSIINCINRYLILAAFLFIYYISIILKVTIDGRGSDLVLMIFQSSKGILIAVMTCFLSNDVMSLICSRKNPKRDNRNGYTMTLVNNKRNRENMDNPDHERFSIELQKV